MVSFFEDIYEISNRVVAVATPAIDHMVYNTGFYYCRRCHRSVEYDYGTVFFPLSTLAGDR